MKWQCVNRPCDIKEKIRDTDNIVYTHDRRRKSYVCHINMLKEYVTCSDAEIKTPVLTVAPEGVPLS